jgi:hypothetical protein
MKTINIVHWKSGDMTGKVKTELPIWFRQDGKIAVTDMETEKISFMLPSDIKYITPVVIEGPKETVQQQYNVAIVHTVFVTGKNFWEKREQWELMLGTGSFAKTTVLIRTDSAKKLIEDLGLTATNALCEGVEKRTLYS